MITTEEWDRAFELTVPIVATGLEVLAVSLAIIALRRLTSPLGQRVYYQDGQYLVSVRYGGWHDLREFVQPDNPDVLAVYSQCGPDYWSLYDFVCRNINYRKDIGEFWQTPSETLASKVGDCEDTSIVLCSLLRNAIDAHVALGSFQGYGHAWVAKEGQIYETTYTRAMLVSDPQDYCPYVLFSDREVIELWPGALGEVFEIRRNESMKLGLMAKALEAIA